MLPFSLKSMYKAKEISIIMVWDLVRSQYSMIRGHFGLRMAWSEVTLVRGWHDQRSLYWYIFLFYLLSYMFGKNFCNWISAEFVHSYGLGQHFERTLVWTMVWNSSRQWSGNCLSMNISVWNSSVQRRHRAQSERTRKIIKKCFREQVDVVSFEEPIFR